MEVKLQSREVTVSQGGPLTQAERRAQSRRRLLDAALALVAEKGVAKTTTAEIGERAGFSRGMVRERFGSKSGLMNVLARHVRNVLVHDVLVPAVNGASGVQAMVRSVEATIATLERDPLIPAAMVALLGEAVVADRELRPGIAWAWNEYREELKGYVGEAVEAGEVPSFVDPEITAFFIIALQIGTAILHTIDEDRIEPALIRERGVAMLRHLIQFGDPSGRPPSSGSSKRTPTLTT